VASASSILKQIRGASADAIDFCFPPTCRVCDARAQRWPLCEDCHTAMLELERGDYCTLCALPVAERGAPCPYCLGEGLFPFDRVLRLANYQEPIKPLVVAMKFHHAWPIGEFFAGRLFAQQAIRDLLSTADLIVPVPLHPRRQVARGYNQAEVIARRLGKFGRVPVRQVAARLADTHAQSLTQSKSLRIENLRHAFGLLYPKQVAGRNVILLDDVRTTAATLQSLGRCIRSGKPARLSAIVVATADPRHSNFEEI